MIKIICDLCDLTITGKWKPSFDSSSMQVIVDKDFLSSLKVQYPKVISDKTLCINCIDRYEQEKKIIDAEFNDRIQQLEDDKKEKMNAWLREAKHKTENDSFATHG